MPSKSATDDTIRVRAKDLHKATDSELEEVLALMDEPVDTSDIPSHPGPFRGVQRDAEGHLPEPLPELRDSPIRKAILEQLGRQEMTRYELWQKARVHCPRISRSAVYEYLRGQRAISTPYIEALLAAAGLGVGPIATPGRRKVVRDTMAPGRRAACAVASKSRPKRSAD